MIINHTWSSLNQTFEARASEWALAAITVCLGLVCLLNLDLFDNPIYHYLRTWANPEIWGSIFVLIGASRLTVLFINGGYWRTPHFRSIFAFTCCFLWFQLSLGFASNLGFGLAVYPWLFFLDAYNALRAGREAGIAQYLQKHRRETQNGGSTNDNQS